MSVFLWGAIVGAVAGWMARTGYQALLYDTIKSLRRQMHGQPRRKRRR